MELGWQGKAILITFPSIPRETPSPAAHRPGSAAAPTHLQGGPWKRRFSPALPLSAQLVHSSMNSTFPWGSRWVGLWAEPVPAPGEMPCPVATVSQEGQHPVGGHRSCCYGALGGNIPSNGRLCTSQPTGSPVWAPCTQALASPGPVQASPQGTGVSWNAIVR